LSGYYLAFENTTAAQDSKKQRQAGHALAEKRGTDKPFAPFPTLRTLILLILIPPDLLLHGSTQA
jgi:hypothetical protein